jgi:hypothetical protein
MYDTGGCIIMDHGRTQFQRAWHVAMSPAGLKRTFSGVRSYAAISGQADIKCV